MYIYIYCDLITAVRSFSSLTDDGDGILQFISLVLVSTARHASVGFFVHMARCRLMFTIAARTRDRRRQKETDEELKIEGDRRTHAQGDRRRQVKTEWADKDRRR